MQQDVPSTQRAALLALFDKEQRVDITYPDIRKDVTAQIVRFIRPAPGKSFILYSRLEESNLDVGIQEQVDYFTCQGLPFSWKVYEHDPMPAIKEHLLAHGFEADDVSVVMFLDLQQTPRALLKPPIVDIRPVRNREGLLAVIQVMEQVWGGDFSWITNRLGPHLEILGYLNVYVAYIDDQPACAGWIYFHPNSQFASLWGGSTVEAYRGRGLYRALLAQRAQDTLRSGRRFLTLDASPMSQPIVARHGFQALTHVQWFDWPDKNSAETT